MKTRLTPKIATALLSLSTFTTFYVAQTPTCVAQGTAFTYQGKLAANATPANGFYDLRIILYTADVGGTQTGPVLTNTTSVNSGLFTVPLDFGDVFNGTNYWLDIAVRTNGVGGFTPLAPRQPITPTPYAMFAGKVTAGGLSPGTYANPVTLNNAANSFAGNFAGNGSGLSNLNATTLTGLAASNFWQLGGNTITSNQPLGSINWQPLDFIIGGYRALRLEFPDAGSVNTISPTVIGGSWANHVVSDGGFCRGGVIGGGGNYTYPNVISNTTSFATISGGVGNVISNWVNYATIGGGQFNRAFASEATVAGGAYNGALGFSSAVGGGGANTASGSWSTIPGGLENSAADYAFAAGHQAKASHTGAFVWASGNTQPYYSFDPSRFHIYASNGFSIDYSTQRPGDGGGNRWVSIGIPFIGSNTLQAWNGAKLTDGGVWQNASDANRKTDFSVVDVRAILDKVVALPVRSWRYTNEAPDIRHLGPTAQDFKVAFALGTDDESIGTVDEEGVALAAIQGLNQRLEDQVKQKDAEIAQLKRELGDLKQLVNSLIPTRSGGGR